MTLQQLELIVSLDINRNFVSAAEYSNISQPALSTAVKKLEDELGIIIFDRTKKPLEPTKEGAVIITKARKILKDVTALRESTKTAAQSMEGTFRVGIIPTLAPYLLPLFLNEFTQNNPKTILNIKEMETQRIVDGLKNETLDLGILVTPLDEVAIKEVPLFNEPFLVYASKESKLRKLKQVRPHDITMDGLWLLEQGHCFRNQILNICGGNAINPRGFNYESGSIEALKRLVDTNMGYTLVPELAVTDNLDNPRLKRFVDPQPVREVSLVYHQSFYKLKLVETLSKLIREKVPGRFIKQTKFKKIKIH